MVIDRWVTNARRNMVTSRIHTVGRRRDTLLEVEIRGVDSSTIIDTVEVVCVSTWMWIDGVVAESLRARQVMVA